MKFLASLGSFRDIAPKALRAATFDGYRDYVASRAVKPFGYEDEPVPMLTLKPDTWEYVKRLGDNRPGVQLKFPDRSAAFFKRCAPEKDEQGKDITPRINRTMVLSEYGASVLSDQLGLEVVLRSEILNLPKLQAPHPFAPVSGLGVISDWIENIPYANASDTIRQEARRDTARLFQLYVYMAVTKDIDQHDENIVISTPSHQLWSIDHEGSGGTASTPLNPHTPLELFDDLMDQPLPADLQAKLVRFVNNQKTHEAQLRGYYQPEQVNEIFKRARYLARNPVVQPLFDFYDKALYHNPD